MRDIDHFLLESMKQEQFIGSYEDRLGFVDILEGTSIQQEENK